MFMCVPHIPALCDDMCAIGHLDSVLRQQAILDAVSDMARDIKEMRDANNNMCASNIDSGAFEVGSPGSAQNTRGMSTSVPAALIRGVWYDVYPKEPLPVPFKYLKSICDAAMGEFPDGVKNRMGAVLSKYMEQIDGNVKIHEPILIILCRINDRYGAETRSLCMSLTKVLGTHLVFLLPSRLNLVLEEDPMTTIN